MLLNALQKLSSLHQRKGHQIGDIAGQMIKRNPRLKKKYQRPALDSDVLYQSTFVHAVSDQPCADSCPITAEHVVQRESRDDDQDDPVIHYGLIASADRLMKDAQVRDRLGQIEGVLCFEMEAAGLMDDFPCLVIRGICDYSDSHKSDAWQGYAATSAAAYAKELLGVIAAEDSVATGASEESGFERDMSKFTTRRTNKTLGEMCSSIEDPNDERWWLRILGRIGSKSIVADISVAGQSVLDVKNGLPVEVSVAVQAINVSDAMKIRKILFDLLEKASLPNTSLEKVKELLHIVVVGGGPTGIEMTAELDDLAHNELQDLYPGVGDKLSISIHDIAPNILSAYDKKLRHIEVKTNSHIERVEKDCLYTKEDGRIGCGMLVWATGNKSVPLLDELDVRKTQKGLTRILTDSRLRVFSGKDEASLHEGVFALGDAADIDGAALPTTAEVAVQKAKYLVEVFNSASSDPAVHAPFRYQQKQLVSYIGGRDGVIAGKDNDHEGWTGRSTWLAWRGHNVLWNRNLRSRVMMIFTWALNSIFGKEIAKI
ncbi:hypothetical protein LTR70_001650 [Exophiala xenobiotica]|uniref:FAD/NAD(P)-binding domain-containing protein n=1 Tax=Lithohypha guttulata TaxID=1690604 RepID=A0ABR0KHC8_9EURO|nr:hypothetical protein LTR24_002541 [Lithohypha guttulata]KAK5327175.1 hypothetical protein LTR70_001650 [Exophiala xenobiotica]